jgi:hypothetical protein
MNVLEVAVSLVGTCNVLQANTAIRILWCESNEDIT